MLTTDQSHPCRTCRRYARRPLGGGIPVLISTCGNVGISYDYWKFVKSTGVCRYKEQEDYI